MRGAERDFFLEFPRGPCTTAELLQPPQNDGMKREEGPRGGALPLEQMVQGD